MVWISLFITLLFTAESHSAEPQKTVQPIAPSFHHSAHPLEAWFPVVEQAEAVERELLKLIYNDVSLPAKSLMGQFKLVLAKELKKKHGQVVYSCQRFSLQSSRVNSYSIYQACLPKERPEIIYAEISASGSLELNFYLQNLVDVVGFGTSILKRSTRCLLQKKDGELQQLTCHDLGNSRTPVEVMMLDEMIYDKTGMATLTASGKFYKELLPSRTIAVYVPREGKVTVEIKSLYKKPVVNTPMPIEKLLPLKAVEGRERLPGELGVEPERLSQMPQGAFAPLPSQQQLPSQQNLNDVPTTDLQPVRPLPEGRSIQPSVSGESNTPTTPPTPEAEMNIRGRFEMKPVVPSEGTDHNLTPQH